MKTKSADEREEARRDLDVPPTPKGALRRGVLGKYYRDVMGMCNVVRIADDLAGEFPNEAAVNEALRELSNLRVVLRGLVGRQGAAKARKTA